ncbi:hypothetical protein [Actinoplanes sp. GCM10030250]|uniref:hypothetical protein n=1 Tax=Actinoplanes sp. GCM10030250 TaxID=3273376 RepID=UPI00360D0C17
MGNGTRRKWLGALVAVQAILVLPVVFLWLGPAQQSVPVPGEHPAAGLLGLYLIVFGLPWSLLACLADNQYGLFGGTAGNLLIAGPALLNLVVTTGALWWTGREIDDYEDDYDAGSAFDHAFDSAEEDAR